MTIRTADAADAELLAVMNQEVHSIHTGIAPDIFKAYDKDGMREQFELSLRSENKKCFLAFEGSEPAGYVLVSKNDYPETYFKRAYSALYVEQICVLNRFAGKKIGKALVSRVKSHAEDLGVKRIELDYWCKNASAGRFFTSQGFSPYLEKMYFEIGTKE